MLLLSVGVEESSSLDSSEDVSSMECSKITSVSLLLVSTLLVTIGFSSKPLSSTTTVGAGAPSILYVLGSSNSTVSTMLLSERKLSDCKVLTSVSLSLVTPLDSSVDSKFVSEMHEDSSLWSELN